MLRGGDVLLPRSVSEQVGRTVPQTAVADPCDVAVQKDAPLIDKIADSQPPTEILCHETQTLGFRGLASPATESAENQSTSYDVLFLISDPLNWVLEGVLFLLDLIR